MSRNFGPTYPIGSDDLRYPGLWFSFEEDVRPIGVAAKDAGIEGAHPEDRLKEVKKILISQKGNDGKEQDALDEVAECPAMHGDIERAIIKVSSYLILTLLVMVKSLVFRCMTEFDYISILRVPNPCISI